MPDFPLRPDVLRAILNTRYSIFLGQGALKNANPLETILLMRNNNFCLVAIQCAA